MTWHRAPLASRVSRFARDGSAVFAWERHPGGATDAALYRYDFRTDRDAAAVVERILADPFPGGVLLQLARLSQIEAVRLA